MVYWAYSVFIRIVLCVPCFCICVTIVHEMSFFSDENVMGSCTEMSIAWNIWQDLELVNWETAIEHSLRRKSIWTVTVALQYNVWWIERVCRVYRVLADVRWEQTTSIVIRLGNSYIPIVSIPNLKLSSFSLVNFTQNRTSN